jgi:hypothetical protein
MTRLVAHADPSTLGDWPWWGWVLAAIALSVAGVYLAAGPIVHRAPTQAPDVSRLDALDGVTYTPRCVMAHCGLAGTIARVTTADLGIETVRVCPGHADEGSVKGWWVSLGGIPFDRGASA